MFQPLALRGALVPAPRCPIALGDPAPLREWLLQGVVSELVHTRAVSAVVTTVSADRAIRVELPLGAVPPTGLASIWGSMASQPGVLRAFRTGMMEIEVDGAVRPCAVAMESLAGGRFWLSWWPIPPVIEPGKPFVFDDLEGPTADRRHPGHVHARSWLDGFEVRYPGLRFGVPRPAEAEGPPVLLVGAPLVTPLPRDLDGIAGWLDALISQDRAILTDAIARPPVIITVRGGNYERLIVRRAYPIGYDDLIRNLCVTGERPPEAVIVLEPGNILVDGQQLRSVACVIESRRQRLTRQLAAGPVGEGGPWRDPVRTRLRDGEGWIGIQPNARLDLHADRTMWGNRPPEA